MKITSDSIRLNDKVFEATEVDYNSYAVEHDSIDIDNNTFEASKTFGIENDPTIYKIIQEVNEDGTSTLYIYDQEEEPENSYYLDSIMVGNTQELYIQNI